MRLSLSLSSLTLCIMCLISSLSLEATGSPHIHSQETATRNALIAIPQVVPSGMEGVDCFYMINLANRKERWKRIETLCKKHNLSPSRVNAINGTLLSVKTIRKLFGNYRIKMRRGAIGCLLSHVSAFLDSSQRRFNCVWICEDDIEFLENPHQMSGLLNQLTTFDPDWDILYTDPDMPYTIEVPESFELPFYNYNLHYTFRPDEARLSKESYLSRHKIDENFTLLGQRFGMYSYFVSKKGIQKLLNYFLHVYLWSPIDADIHHIPGIRQYVLNKQVISHWRQSTIHDTEKM